MLEALISLRMNGETEICRSGDVLCVKLAGAAWGRSERREQMVVQWG